MSLRRNISLHYCFSFTTYLVLHQALWMIYLTDRGFSLVEVGILEAIFHLTSFLSEVPTGAAADLWGRKASRLLGRVCFLISLGIMVWAGTFWGQALGFMFCAWAYNLESGAGEAFLFDSLAALGRREDFSKAMSRVELIRQAASVAAFLGGGYLAVRSFEAVFGIEAVLASGGLALALGFREPPIDRTETAEKTGVLGAMGRQFTIVIRTIRREPALAALMAGSELLFAFETTAYFYLQPHWKSLGYSEAVMGLVFAVTAVISGLVGLAGPRAVKARSMRTLVVFFYLFYAVCLGILGFITVHPGFFLIFGAMESFFVVIVSDAVNRKISSEIRATVISCQSMFFSIAMILLFPLAGWVNQRWSIEVMFQVLWAAAVFAGGIGLAGFFSRRGVTNSGS